MLHKKLVIGVMDPDSPLNRAHQLERQAERMLVSGHHEKATMFYNHAAEHLEVAMEQTQNPAALLSLRLQIENLRKQPQIVKKRQQWGERKQDLVLTVWNTYHENRTITDRDGRPSKLSSVGGHEEAWPEEERERAESTEFRLNSSEETDSLLGLIRQHVDQEDEKPKYRLAQLLEAFKTLSLGKMHLHSPDISPNGHSTENQQKLNVSQTEQTIRAALMTQNRELQNHLVQLFNVLDSCERENEKLKEKVQDLTQQLEECRQHHGGRENHFGIPSETRFDAPFSLVDGFACTPPTEALPPLTPLDIASFDHTEDTS